MVDKKFVDLYDNLYKKKKPGLKSAAYMEFALSLLIKYGQGKVLDVGCGRSTLTMKASELFDVVGLDISVVALEFMRKVCKRAEFVVGDCTNLPFNNETFDTILALEIIEHLTEADGDKLLEEAKRVLRPRGKIIITSPIRLNPVSRFIFLILAYLTNPRGSRTHVKEYNMLELFEKVSKQFKVIHFSKSGPAKILRGHLSMGGGRQFLVGEK